MSEPVGSKFGPPEFDPWAAMKDVPPLDVLFDQSVQHVRELDPHPDGRRRFEGEMEFGHMALMGPPGRLQGGFHCVARLFPVLSRISGHDESRTFPCGINVRLLKPVPLFKKVAFEAKYKDEGDRWWLTTRFAGSERLDAAAWSLESSASFDPSQWESWKKSYERAEASPGKQTRVIMGLPYVESEDLFCAKVRGVGADEQSDVQRFRTEDGHLSLPFLCYHLDVIGALAFAFERECPHFTTQVSLALSGEVIPHDETLLCLTNRKTMRPDAFSTARPLEIKGKEVGTQFIEVLLANEDFSHIYAHGWVAAHPMDPQLMLKMTQRFATQLDKEQVPEHMQKVHEEHRRK
ncbi:MAG: hypothetical protein KDH09_10955 [Chrysiogenetes bacterium]|nr:hypothetical protein [Chrysiogenetes bacterium]